MTAREASDYVLKKGVRLSPYQIWGHAKHAGVNYRYVIFHEEKGIRQVIDYDRKPLVRLLDRLAREMRGK